MPDIRVNVCIGRADKPFSEVPEESNIMLTRWASSKIGQLALAAVLVSAVFSIAFPFRPRTEYRVYRIGVDSSPPMAEIQEDGKPAGLAVELINEAASRRHIALEWISTDLQPERALISGLVDMWPVVGITEQRRRLFHLTEPWFFNTFCIIEKQQGADRTLGNLVNKKVAYTGFPLATMIARQFLPGAELVNMGQRALVLDAVCSGAAAAGFDESSYVGIRMLDRPPVCRDVALKINLVEGAVANVAIGSTRAAAPAADALRDELSKLAVDGTMLKSLNRWSSFSVNETRSIPAMQTTEQRSRILTCGLGLAVLALLCVLWQVQRISAARRIAERANSVKSEFLANMSHEIRTPMNGVLGLLGLVLDGEISPSSRKELEAARQSGQDLLAILNDILDLSTVEAGKFRVENSNFDLRSTLQDLADFFEPRCREKGLQIHLNYPPSVPSTFFGDQRRIRQIATNFVGNAFKFTDQGSIVIAAREERHPDGEVLIRISVADTGIGIPPVDQQRLFQKFTQLDSSASRRHGGTGLGLAIAREMATLLGGSVGMQSHPGGSTFWLEIPLCPREHTRLNPHQSQPETSEPELAAPLFQQSSARRILIAEDNKVNQLVLTRSLQKLGYQVDLACNGLEAVERWGVGDYDAILMDCQMPEMDGYEATRTIRACKTRQARLPIIAITAHAMAGDAERCKSAGMDAYLSKPLVFADLERLLKEHIPNLR